jgi:uncharacterized membrane protein
MRDPQTSRCRPVSENKGGLDRIVSSVLLAGLCAALILMLAGVLLALFRDGQSLPHVITFAGMFGSLASLGAEGLFGLGLLILLATPAARVLAGMLVFGRRRQWRFVFVGLFVLAVLALSAFFGLRG